MYFTQKYQESIFKDLNTIKYKISKSHFHFGLEYHYSFSVYPCNFIFCDAISYPQAQE